MANPTFNYSGNPDFRGWLQAQNNLSWINNYVGNDAQINRGQVANDVKYSPNRVYAYGSPENFQNYVSGLYNQYNQQANPNPVADQWATALSQLNASRTPVPRMVNFDLAGSWNKAREMATNAVSPVYQQKMTDFINRQQTELERQKADTQTGKGALDTALSRALEDSGLTRTRTAQDVSTNIGDINASQTYNARQEGLDYDKASRALNEGLSASGTADTGLGHQQVTEANRDRTTMSNEQVRQSTNKVVAQNTLMSRTFQDLETTDTRNTQDTTAKKAKLDIDMERFIEDQAFNRDQEQKNQELSKQADVASQSINYQGQLVDQWLASLAGKGYNAQEVANAASIYR